MAGSLAALDLRSHLLLELPFDEHKSEAAASRPGFQRGHGTAVGEQQLQDHDRADAQRQVLLPRCAVTESELCSRLEAAPASRPFSISVVRRLTTWSIAMECQVIPSAAGLAFALLIGLFRQAGSSLTAMAHPATKARSPLY